MYYNIVLLTKTRPWAGIPPPVILLFSGGSNERTPHDYLQKIPKMKKK